MDLNTKGGGGSGSGECSKGGIGKGCLLPMHNANGGKQNNKLAKSNKINGKGLKSNRTKQKKKEQGQWHAGSSYALRAT
jgi:hypothetical protein